MANITVAGVGYAGHVTGACLADLGNLVVCINRDRTKSDDLRKGILPIYEPGLQEIVRRNIYDPKPMAAMGFTYRSMGCGYNGEGNQ